jgi:Undecaprenyl-phosphate galactose phosphotransferase WbaP
MTLAEYNAWYGKRHWRTSSALTSLTFVFTDLLAIMATFGWGFFWVRIYCFINTDFAINSKSFILYWPYLPVFIIIFFIFNLYPGISLAPSEELRRFSISSVIAYGGIILSRYIERNNWDTINTAFVISCVSSTIILLWERSAAHWFLRITKLGGIPAVIYGSGGTSKLVVKCLLNSGNTGYIPVLILDDDTSGENEFMGVPVIHDMLIGPEIEKRYKIRMAIVAMPHLEIQQLKHLINVSVSAFRYNIVIPNYFDITTVLMSVRDFAGILGIDISNKLKLIWNLRLKRVIDLASVIIGGILISPFLLLISLFIKITSSGPVLYKQKRLGKNGKHFFTYKFRSMTDNAERQLQNLIDKDAGLKTEWEQNHKLRNDPRITGIGRLLRRTSLDELPQLINILKGEMSLVGPRPIVDEEVIKYGEDYNRVFSNKPGLTGLWQVSGRSNAKYHDRIVYDTYYLQNWSIWLDLWIIYKTIGVIVSGKGAY